MRRHNRSEGAMRTGRLHMSWYRVDEENVVTSLGQGRGVHSGRTADVDDPRTGWHALAHDLLGPLELQHPLA